MEQILGILGGFLMFGLIVTYLALKVHWMGGPASIAIVFLLVSFGPSLVYAVITDDSSMGLFSGSVLLAFAIAGLMIWLRRRKHY
jgi:hypothetical protein